MSKDKMSFDADSSVLFSPTRGQLTLDQVIAECSADPKRVLVDDELGTVFYVGDLDIHNHTGIGNPITGAPPPDYNGHWMQKVVQISVVTHGPKSIRRQIGAMVTTVLGDSVFLVKEGNRLRKVRGSDLMPGMILHSGEKIYW